MSHSEIPAFGLPPGRIWLRIAARAYARVTGAVLRSVNVSEVTDFLVVGGAFRKDQIGLLRARGITAVVDCRKEARDDQELLARDGIHFLHLPAPDRHAPTYEQLSFAVRWALGQLTGGGRVFVHCEHGIGRGPLLGSAILVACGKSAHEAVRMIRSARWQALPNNRQLRALLAFEQNWST